MTNWKWTIEGLKTKTQKLVAKKEVNLVYSNYNQRWNKELEENFEKDDEIERKRLWHMEKVSKVGLEMNMVSAFGKVSKLVCLGVGSEISV